MPKQHSSPTPAAPPPREVPWRWLAVAIVAGGLVGWAAANANSFRSASTSPAPANSVTAALKPAAIIPDAALPKLPLAPAAPINAAQSNTLFHMTNRVAAASPVATNAAPPQLLTAQATPLPAPVAPAPRMGETLYNGIVLPAVWPPKGEYKPGEPMPVPYLSNPPPVIDITAGRQLFVDDFLIEQTTLKRVWHPATLYSNNPVMRPDQEWERAGNSPMAMPFSDGVWYDQTNQLFKMWYMAGYGRGTALATSTNGLDWQKPKWDVQPGTGLVQTDPRDSSTVWFDQTDPDPARRYKMWRSHKDGDTFGLSLHFSADGIHWGPRVLRTGSAGDRTTVFYNPFRKVWVYSLRHGWGEPRARRYWEVRDLLAGPHWNQIGEPPMWVGSDRLDPMRVDLQVKPQLYNLDATAYESLMVGLFTIWRGDKNIPEGRPKPNSIWLGFSRDGYHWDRPDRRPLIDVSEKKGDWNWGNVQSTAGGFMVVGRNLWFYFSGRAGAADKRDAGGATGLAFLRRDGFASMDAGPEGGVLTTRPVKFNARFMFVNMKTNAPDGELRIEILHADGRPIEMTKNDTKERVVPLTKELSSPLAADQTLMGVSWLPVVPGQQGIQDLSMLAGKPVRFRFHLKNASLYSFWIGPGQLGRSMGYVAAGGPHFPGPTDTVGNKSYGAFPVAPRTNAPPTTNAVSAPVAPPKAPAPAKPPEKK
ncbi:MAG: hypothetical protein ABMA26_20995 [Limisphaerales bacterium]